MKFDEKSVSESSSDSESFEYLDSTHNFSTNKDNTGFSRKSPRNTVFMPTLSHFKKENFSLVKHNLSDNVKEMAEEFGN